MRLYSDDELLDLLRLAIRRTWQEEGSLIERRAGERAVTHRVGLHLQALFPTHHVDCEYNRNMNGSKLVDVDVQYLTTQERRKYFRRARPNGPARPVQQAFARIKPAPDVIVHRRLSNQHNLLIAEFKFDDDNRAQEGQRYDVGKLMAFTRPDPYNYQLGVFVELQRRRRDAAMIKIQGGEIIGNATLRGV